MEKLLKKIWMKKKENKFMKNRCVLEANWLIDTKKASHTRGKTQWVCKEEEYEAEYILQQMPKKKIPVFPIAFFFCCQSMFLLFNFFLFNFFCVFFSRFIIVLFQQQKLLLLCCVYEFSLWAIMKIGKTPPV